MTQIQVENIINEWKQEAGNKKAETENQLEIAQFLERAEPLLQKDPREQYLQIAEAYLNGIIGLSHFNRRNMESDERLWITKPGRKEFYEKNMFFKVTDNLAKLIKLGSNIKTVGNLKTTIEAICHLLRKQPLMIELIRANADYVECIMCMGIINLHFEGREFISIHEIIEKFNLPTSYAARFTNRINSGYSVLVNEEFITCMTGGTMHYSLCLGKKCLELLCNPSDYYAK